jgi:L-2-hydroxycarboxylate dehydrogenase (NAD+)
MRLRYHNYEREVLREFGSRILQTFDVPKADAELAVRVLDCADSRGHPSHGCQRLDAYYGKLKAGEINPRPNPRFVSGGPERGLAGGTFDGDNGLGLVVAPKANEACLEMADRFGIAGVTVRNSNHFGTAAFYPLMALKRGMIGQAMTTSTPLVAPFGGNQKFFGTDAFATGFPGKTERGLMSDMATSVAAVGKMEICIRAGLPIPDCWAFDAEGNPTTDPAAGRQGALRPAGADRAHAGHKGTCLATVVQGLCGMLAGAAWGPFTPRFTMAYESFDPPPGVIGVGTGHYLQAWKVSAYRDPDEFGEQVDQFIDLYMKVRPSIAADEELAYPGLVEWRSEERYAVHIPVMQQVVDSFRQMSKETGIPLPDSLEVYEETVKQ